ncbi:hypothetical protein LQK93_01719 [Terrabacter sp. BE26]
MSLFPLVSLVADRPDLAAALSRRGCITTPSAAADVLVVEAAQAGDDQVREALAAGRGVVVLGAPSSALAGVVARREDEPHENGTDAGLHPAVRVERDTEIGEDLLARVDLGGLRATGSLTVEAPAQPVVAAGGAPVVATTGGVTPEGGRAVVLAVEPVSSAGDQSFAELVHNAVSFVAPRPVRHAKASAHPLVSSGAWVGLKAAVTDLRALQAKDGSVPEEGDHAEAAAHVGRVVAGIEALAPSLPHDADYLEALVKDFSRWADSGFGVPDFYDSLVAFEPAQHRADGLVHVVVFPMYTQNGNPARQVEAVLLEVIWPDFVAELEGGDYSNKLFLPIRFLDFTAGYDTNSAVLFPETVAMREIPTFTWGGIFADREAARFRRVVTEAASVTRLSLPPDAARLLADQQLAERAFVMWDLIHDRTHMHGDLPFDPFMIKQRMPYFLYSLEELRCDLTAFREAVALEGEGHPYARFVQYAVLFDRIFRFAITGDRTRNYDGLGGQLLFAWLHQRGVLHWTDNRLTIEWDRVAEPVLELGRAVEDLYWRSIDRPKVAHWLAAYDLIASVLTPHPMSAWARHRDGDLAALPLDGPPKGLTDAVLPDEFPLSMFYEALSKKMKDVIESTAGITGASA